MRNPEIPLLAEKLRALGHFVYDDWHAPGPEADEYWRQYELARGHKYQEALAGWHAHHVFENDKFHLDLCDTGVLLMPAGRSAHLELGYLARGGKETYVVFPQEPDRFDIMYRFCTGVFTSVEDLVAALA